MEAIVGEQEDVSSKAQLGQRSVEEDEDEDGLWELCVGESWTYRSLSEALQKPWAGFQSQSAQPDSLITSPKLKLLNCSCPIKMWRKQCAGPGLRPRKV